MPYGPAVMETISHTPIAHLIGSTDSDGNTHAASDQIDRTQYSSFEG